MHGKKTLSQLSPYQQGKQIEEIQREYGLEKIVKLSSNENPFGNSTKVSENLLAHTSTFNVYPDGHATELRSEMAKKLHINEDELIFGNGSDELVQIICRTFLESGANTVMATPTFPQYRHHAIIEGASIKEVPTKSGYHDLDSMLEVIDEDTRIVWICSPDNPTGTLLSKEAFYNFMDQCPKEVLVILDEAYYEYIDPALDFDALENRSLYKNIIILRTFSKAYGLAGLRIGYGIMDEAIAAKINIVRGPFNTSLISQQAALLAMHDHQFIDDTVMKNRAIMHDFQAFLADIGWSYYDSQTNFILISTPISGTEVFEYLLKNGYIIRPGELLGYPNTIRVTIGLDADMKQLQNLLYQLHLHINNEV